MKYDFSCSCGKGIRILRGDLSEVTCGACGRAVPVPQGVRSGLPSEFRGLAAPLPVVAPAKAGAGERVFFRACWAVAAAFFAVPFFVRSEAVEAYRKAKADPTIVNLNAYFAVEPGGRWRPELLTRGWEAAIAGNDVDRLTTFLHCFGGELYSADITSDLREEKHWAFTKRVGTEKAYALYLEQYSYGAHVDEARQELGRLRGETPPATEASPPDPGTETPPQEREGNGPVVNEEPPQETTPTAEDEQRDLSALQQSATRDGAIAFLDKYPNSSSRGAVASILLSQLEGTWQDSSEAPSPSTLRQIIEAKGSTEITVSVTGFTGEDTRGNVFEHLKSRLEGIGLRVTQVESGGDVRVTGSESTDTTKTYNKFGLPETGPYAEDISVTVEVWLPDAVEAAFSTASYASSPSSVGYTVYNDVDVGPSQWDVHRATLEELSKAMDPVFRYR